MKKILLCLVALLCVTVVSAQEDDLTPVELALMVGKTNDAIKARAEYVDTMPSGVEVYILVKGMCRFINIDCHYFLLR